MERFRPWWRAARPDQALLVPLCVEIGAACAHFDAQRGPGIPAHILIDAAALAAGLGVNLIDHLWDLPGVPRGDPKNPPPEHERPLPGREAAVAAAGCLFVAALLAGSLAPLSGAAALGFGTLAVLIGVWRRAPAVGADMLGYGLGDVATFLAVGPLAVLTGYASQTGFGSWGAVFASLPVGLSAAAVFFGRHFTHRAVDVNLRRMTPVASWGDDRARAFWLVLPLLAAAATLILESRGEYPPRAWIASAPLIAFVAAGAWRFRANDPDRDERDLEALALWTVAASLLAIFATLRLGAST